MNNDESEETSKEDSLPTLPQLNDSINEDSHLSSPKSGDDDIDFSYLETPTIQNVSINLDSHYPDELSISKLKMPLELSPAKSTDSSNVSPARMEFRRLKSDGLNKLADENNLSGLPAFQPTRSHSRELSFTECGYDSSKVAEIFQVSPTSQNDSKEYRTVLKMINSESFQSIENDVNFGDLYRPIPLQATNSIPSLHLAQRLSTMDTSSGTLDGDDFEQQFEDKLKLHQDEKETHISKEEENDGLKPASENSTPNISKHSSAANSPMEWLKEVQGDETCVAEAASSKFLLRKKETSTTAN